MRQQGRTSVAASRGDEGWAAFSYLFGGVIVYGGLGWLLDRWLHTAFFLPTGILGGMGLALYTIYARGFRAGTTEEHRDTRDARGDAG
jgi:ATP synthase protein I